MPNVIIVRNTYPDIPSLQRVIAYVSRGICIGGYGVNPEYAFSEMKLVKETYHKTEGVQLKHFLITFSHKEAMELDFDEMLGLGFRVGQLFGEYQMIYGLHVDASHVHLHFCMNTVSFITGKKYADGLAGFQRVCSCIAQMYPRYETRLIFRETYSPAKKKNIK